MPVDRPVVGIRHVVHSSPRAGLITTLDAEERVHPENIILIIGAALSVYVLSGFSRQGHILGMAGWEK